MAVTTWQQLKLNSTKCKTNLQSYPHATGARFPLIRDWYTHYTTEVWVKCRISNQHFSWKEQLIRAEFSQAIRVYLSLVCSGADSWDLCSAARLWFVSWLIIYSSWTTHRFDLWRVNVNRPKLKQFALFGSLKSGILWSTARNCILQQAEAILSLYFCKQQNIRAQQQMMTGRTKEKETKKKRLWLSQLKLGSP